jgi:hypothetical protein
MKCYPEGLKANSLPVVMISLLMLFTPTEITQATALSTWSDEFSGTSVNGAKWVVIGGSPSVANGKLTLTGGLNTLTEMQSINKFGHSVLRMLITSSSWRPQSATTDSSFGFEIWQGANGACHYSVILKANGHLGLMKPQPDATGKCFGDPEFQAHLPITNWEAIRAGKTIRLTLTWAPNRVTLHVSSGNKSGGAVYDGEAEPTNQLKIRLNADKGETFKVDYVRVEAVP